MRYLNIHPLLKKYGIQPKKSLGQNFLIESGSLNKILTASEVSSTDHVLEIGAGLGSLTYLLAQSAKSVTAVEIDRAMLAPLAESLDEFINVKIVQGDILELDPATLIPDGHYVVVANIPYYITSAIIRHLLGSNRKPSLLVLTVQKEVAERIVARDKKHSLLSLSVHVFGLPEIAGNIPAGSFFPAPEVDSAILRIKLYADPLISLSRLDTFFKLAHAGFSQKRKTLRNSLSAGLGISSGDAENLLMSAGINPQRRAETLNLEEWNNLTLSYSKSEPMNS